MWGTQVSSIFLLCHKRLPFPRPLQGPKRLLAFQSCDRNSSQQGGVRGKKGMAPLHKLPIGPPLCPIGQNFIKGAWQIQFLFWGALFSANDRGLVSVEEGRKWHRETTGDFCHSDVLSILSPANLSLTGWAASALTTQGKSPWQWLTGNQVLASTVSASVQCLSLSRGDPGPYSLPCSARPETTSQHLRCCSDCLEPADPGQWWHSGHRRNQEAPRGILIISIRGKCPSTSIWVTLVSPWGAVLSDITTDWQAMI